LKVGGLCHVKAPNMELENSNHGWKQLFFCCWPCMKPQTWSLEFQEGSTFNFQHQIRNTLMVFQRLHKTWVMNHYSSLAVSVDSTFTCNRFDYDHNIKFKRKDWGYNCQFSTCRSSKFDLNINDFICTISNYLCFTSPYANGNASW
jgi:hypothetical protein